MKPINYRAWNKKDKLMQGIYDIVFCVGGVRVSGTGVYMGNGWAERTDPSKRCDVVLMQFTGKYCFDGTEIFEGDIILQNGVYVPVIWNTEDACFELDFSIHSLHGMPLTNVGLDDLCDRAVVAGHIYENIDLLGDYHADNL